MLSYLSTDSKIRIMENMIRKIDIDSKRIETLGAKKLESKLKRYNRMVKLYEKKISLHCKGALKKLPPSKINKHIASIVVYSEIRKRLLKIIRKTNKLLRTRRSAGVTSSRGIARYM